MARATILLMCLMAALACIEAAEPAPGRSLQGLDPVHYGFGTWWQYSGKKHSQWNGGRKCYNPVTTDRSWGYYRIAIRLQIGFYDTWSPSNLTKVSLFLGVSYGKAYDLATGAEIGVWQSFTVSTADEDPTPGGLTIGTISNLVLELGPNGDDSITIAGATSTVVPTTAINDDDNAITGGIGKFLGAAGSFTYKASEGGATPTAIEGELKIWVPKLKEF